MRDHQIAVLASSDKRHPELHGLKTGPQTFNTIQGGRQVWIDILTHHFARRQLGLQEVINRVHAPMLFAGG